MKYKLDDIDKRQSFKVPDGYFEDLPLKIQQRISEKPKATSMALPSWSLAAVGAVIVFFIAYVFLMPENNPSASELLAEVSNEELVAYLDNIELDEYDIASAIEVGTDLFDFEDTNMLDGIELEDQAIDDVLIQYDLEDEYL